MIQEETKRKYLVKLTGSMGSVYDFSTAFLYDDHDIQETCDRWGMPFKEIKYCGFDKRINFHKWSVLSEEGGHVMWILSTSKQHPYLSEWCAMEEGM